LENTNNKASSGRGEEGGENPTTHSRATGARRVGRQKKAKKKSQNRGGRSARNERKQWGRERITRENKDGTYRKGQSPLTGTAGKKTSGKEEGERGGILSRERAWQTRSPKNERQLGNRKRCFASKHACAAGRLESKKRRRQNTHIKTGRRNPKGIGMKRNYLSSDGVTNLDCS